MFIVRLLYKQGVDLNNTFSATPVKVIKVLPFYSALSSHLSELGHAALITRGEGIHSDAALGICFGLGKGEV